MIKGLKPLPKDMQRKSVDAHPRAPGSERLTVAAAEQATPAAEESAPAAEVAEAVEEVSADAPAAEEVPA